jgi:chemotaxis protein methyltransferase CheR
MEKYLGREFEYTDSDYYRLSELAQKYAGINFMEAKRELVYGRLQKRVRSHNMKSFKQYCDYLEADESSDEMRHFINAITTNVTSFFRENHHFEYLQNVILPEIVLKNDDASKRTLRIWSAGCSSGKEPYSIAMVLRECIPDIDSWDARILATDLDSDILSIAKQGVYPADQIDGISPERRKRWFKRGQGANADTVRVDSAVRDLVHFRQLNLIDDWPMKGLFDCVFYRNVAIYFSRKSQIQIVDRIANYIKSGGYLIVGHSESLFGVTKRFESIGHTIYRKIA